MRRRSSSSSAVYQPCLDPQSTCCRELGGAAQVFFFFCGLSAVLRPSVHILPGIGRCGAGLQPFPIAWWLTHPAAITGVSVSARWDSPVDVVDRLFRFFAVAECRVHDTDSLQVCSQATVSCSQPEYSGLLMSCQAVDWVNRGVVVSSGCFPLTFFTWDRIPQFSLWGF